MANPKNNLRLEKYMKKIPTKIEPFCNFIERIQKNDSFSERGLADLKFRDLQEGTRAEGNE